MERLLDIFALLSLVLLVVVLRSLRREHIRVEHSVSWLTACGVFIALSRSHSVLDGVTRFLRLEEPSVTLLFFVLIVVLAVFYRFSGVVSELKDMNITLTQRVAILEYLLRRKNEDGKETTRE